MKLKRRKPGVYLCRSKQCGYAFVYFGRDRWHGPFRADMDKLHTGEELTWMDLVFGYSDCSARLSPVGHFRKSTFMKAFKGQ